jgi:hypothetical protein
MVSMLQLFSIYSFLCVLDSKINFHVGKELTKIFFHFFKCEIMLYMLIHFKNVSEFKDQFIY